MKVITIIATLFEEKIAIVFSVYGKPPKESVESAVVTELKTSNLPIKIKHKISKIVKNKYTLHNQVALERILGVIFSSTGIGASPKNICLPATEN